MDLNVLNCWFRSLICRPLPIDIGRFTCIIVKEAKPNGLSGGTMYSLYTYVRPTFLCFLIQKRTDEPFILLHHSTLERIMQWSVCKYANLTLKGVNK